MTKPPGSFERPPARRDPERGITVHGRWYADPYAWMERLDSVETKAWLAAQEAVTRKVLDGVPGRDRLRAAVTRYARYPRRSRPLRAGSEGREFLWQADAGDEKLKLLMRRAAGAPHETLIDPNTWPPEETLVFAAPSPDGRLVAMGSAVAGGGATITVLDVERGRVLPDRPRGTNHTSLAWRPDGSGFFYAADPDPAEVPPTEAALWNAIYEHVLGSGEPSRRVFGEGLPKAYWCSVEVSECGRFAVVTAWDFVHANIIFLLRLEDGIRIPVAPEMRSINHVQVIGDTLLIRTDLDAPRGRCCVAPLSAPTEWRTIIPEGPDTLLTVTGIGGRLYAVSSVAAAHRIRIHAEDGTFLRDLPLPAVGSVDHDEGDGVFSGLHGDWGRDEVWLDFTSWLVPPSVYRYDYAAERLEPYHVADVGIDLGAYTIEQVWYESLDGTPVSMSIIQVKGAPRDGRRPVRLSGYGGFNISNEPRFVALNAAWLESGGVVAYANIRGGGEYGRAWHQAAIKTRRQNAFDDYVAAARWLVSAGYTSPGRLLSRGNSNGGLLVAVTAMQAPEAFGAIVSRVPNLDMLGWARRGLGDAAAVEYGSPDDPVEGPYLAGYSPYHTIQADRPYPTMLFIAALDDHVAPAHDPLKMVARLQAEALQGGPFLLLPLHDSGHSGGTTLTARIEQDVDELLFSCWALDVAPPAEPAD